MKLSIFTLAAIVSLATAQLSDLPDCAVRDYGLPILESKLIHSL